MLDLQSSNKQLLIVHAGIVAAVLLSSLGGSKMFQAPSKEWIMHNYFGPQEVRVETPKVRPEGGRCTHWRSTCRYMVDRWDSCAVDIELADKHYSQTEFTAATQTHP